MKIAIVGGKGKLGSLIVEELERRNFECMVADKANDSVNMSIFEADAIVDVSCHTQSVWLAKNCHKKAIPLLIGCTGHTKNELVKIEKYNRDNIKICYNFSPGINFVLHFLENLKDFPAFEASILEEHCKTKKDAPSGTAILLKNIVDKYASEPTQIVSSRFADSPGFHKIKIDLDGEIIEISHTAKDRKVFATGACNMLEKMIEKGRKNDET